MRREVFTDCIVVIRGHLDREVIHVVAVRAGRRTALAARRLVHGHQVDDVIANADLVEADVGVFLRHLPAEHIAVEALHGREVGAADDDVVQPLHGERYAHAFFLPARSRITAAGPP